MAQKINDNDIFESGFLQEQIERAKAFLSIITEWREEFKKIGSEAEKSLSKLNVESSVKDAQQLEKIISSLVGEVEKLNKVRQDEADTQKKVKKLTDEQIKQQILLTEERKNRTQAIKDSLVVQKDQAKSTADLVSRNKLLKKEYDNLDKSASDYAKREKELREEIVENEIAIKRERAAIRDQIKQRDLLEQAIKAEDDTRKGLIKTKRDAIKANKALREATQDLDTVQDEERITELNALIDQNSKLIEDNSDSQTKAKINIGRYAEAIDEALQNNEQYAKTVEVINVLTAISTKLFGKQEDATEDQAKATEELTEKQEDLAESSEKVNNSLKASVIGLIIAAIAALGAAFSTTSEGAETFAVVAAKIEVTLRLLIQRAGAFSLVVVDSFKKAGAEIELFAVKTADLLDIFGKNSEENANKISELNTEIANLDSQIDSNLNRTTQDFSKILQEQLAVIEKLVIEERKYQNELRNIEKRLVTLRGEEQQLVALRDADSSSFKERIDFGERLLKINETIAAEELKRARTSLNFIERRIDLELKQAGITNATADQIRNITQQEDLRRRVSTALLDEQTAALITLQEKNNEFTETLLENNEQLAIVRQDIAERDLDDSLAIAAQQIEANQAIIDSETSTLQQKIKAQEEIVRISEESFKKQVQIIEDAEKENTRFELERLKITGATQEEIRKKEEELLNFNIDAETLLKSVREGTFNERLRQLGLSEIFENRTLEIFETQNDRLREQVQIGEDLLSQKFEELDVSQELEERQKQLGEIIKQNQELEKIGQIKDLEERQKAIEEFNKNREKLAEETDKRILENQIKALEEEIAKRVELGQEDSKKVLDLELELAEKQIELNQKKNEEIEKSNQESLDKQLKDEEDAAKKRAAIYQVLTDIFTKFVKKQNEENLKNIDEQLTAVQGRNEQLAKLAEEGNTQAAQSLAEGNKREAELRLQKEKELQRQKKIEAGLAAFQLLSANAQQDPNTALQKTFQQLLATDSFIDALPAFIDGTENVADSLGSPHLKKVRQDAYLGLVDGIPIRFDGKERIISPDQNERIGDISNEELTKLAEAKEKGIDFKTFESINPDYSPIVMNNINDNIEGNKLLKQVISKLDIISKKEVGFDIDEYEKTLIKTQRVGNKIKREKVRLGNTLFPKRD